MYQGKFTKNHPQSKSPDASPTKQASDAPMVHPVPTRPAVRKNKNGTVLFYSIFAACILVFFLTTAFLVDALRDRLVRYETSQPAYKQNQIYRELFADPDWTRIYELAGIESSTFENADTFAAYMEKKVGNKELTCHEVFSEPSSDKKYIIQLDDEKIASFTITGRTDAPQWELGHVEVFLCRNTSVTVERLPGYTVYINGVALDDSYTIRTASTNAGKYLPEGVQDFHLEQQRVTGLLTPPEVSVQDASGKDVSVTLDPDTGLYTLDMLQKTASSEEKALAQNAIQVYAKYMIGKASLEDIANYFDTGSRFYAAICESEIDWAQTGAAYDFSEAVYRDYYCYSNDLFSIKIDMTLYYTRFDGSTKAYRLDNTLFFQKNNDGKWLVTEATNADVPMQEQVLLTFMKGDEVLSSSLVDAHANSVTLPEVTAPAGMVFTGWAQETIDANGNTILTVIFEPTDGNEVLLPSGISLEPMILKALFEEV